MKSSPSYTILWSTQGGRAKACARRTARILRESASITISTDTTNDKIDAFSQLPDGYYGSSFDDYGPHEFFKLGKGKSLEDPTVKRLVIMFVSTTGDAEQCDSIKDTWRMLLQKSLAADQFQNIQFAMFCLGDRAYGPSAFCAAGRKLAARMVQLGAKPFCDIGYGDDGTPNGGVFNDLDTWLDTVFLKKLLGKTRSSMNDLDGMILPESPYCVKTEKKVTAGSGALGNKTKEWQRQQNKRSYGEFFASLCPGTAYHYNQDGHRELKSEDRPIADDLRRGKPLLGCVVSNERITAKEWIQETKHIHLHVCSKLDADDEATTSMDAERVSPNDDPAPLSYMAGDIATIMPSNPRSTVDRFISCLPLSVQALVDTPLCISTNITTSTQYSSSFTQWPKHATLRGILTHCADISNLPEREDLRALSFYCNPSHPVGADQRKKLLSLSDTSAAALYGDYVLREKRNWADILFDFDSIRFENSDEESMNTKNGSSQSFIPLTIEHLLMILSPILPRHFSIASAPSSSIGCDDDMTVFERGYSLRNGRYGFDVELCVAVVNGKTRHGRKYRGLCSHYLSCLKESNHQNVRIWIRPGSFSKIPMQLNPQHRFETPVVYIGAGTGVAPLRGLIREREAARKLSLSKTNNEPVEQAQNPENVLVFGCRKSSMDYYYQSEWNVLQSNGYLRVLNAFSQDQEHKLYVQRLIREADNGIFLAKHILENNGALYIAGGAKMARAVKDEIIECVGKLLPSGEKGAKVLLLKMQRRGYFSVEAWS